MSRIDEKLGLVSLRENTKYENRKSLASLLIPN